MLYHARPLAQSVRYPWEKKKIQVLNSIERPSQVQRDYRRIIPEIGTPAPIPKPRGKSPGRQRGHKSGERPDRPVIRKSAEKRRNRAYNSRSKETRERASSRRKAQPTKQDLPACVEFGQKIVLLLCDVSDIEQVNFN